MYGWIVDGLSSLFEPVKDHRPAEWPDRRSAQVPGRRGEGAETRRPESHARPAKRHYQRSVVRWLRPLRSATSLTLKPTTCFTSVHVSNGAGQAEQREAKRRKIDVVLSFVKKTVAGVAGLFRLQNPQNTQNSDAYRRYEESQDQQVTLMGIDELHTSWLTGSEWRRMDKSGPNERDRGGRTSFPSSSPLSIRKCSGAGQSGAICDGGKDQCSLQPLASRSALGVGLGGASANADLSHIFFGPSRCFKPSLAVEEAIKQNDMEHYRRLLEMVVTEKYSKSQPLPFNRAKPQDGSPLQGDHRPGSYVRAFDSMPRKTGSISATPSAYSWRNASATKEVKDRRPDVVYTKTFNGAFQVKPHVGCAKSSNQNHPSDSVDLSTEVARRLNLVDRETTALTQQSDQTQTQTSLTWQGSEDLPRLTKDMSAEVSAALTQSDPNLVLSSAFKLRITQRDLATLREGSWLNDEVINFYLSLVMERSSNQVVPGLRVYCFSTFFLPKLRGGEAGQAGGHWAVKRWTKGVDLFLHDLILVPLHLNIHWAMAVIDLRSQTVKSYDSMGQRHDDICSLLLLFLREEHKVKKGRDLDTSRWTVGSLRTTEIPQQKNGNDCGIFACKYADYISKGRPLTFKQCHMPLFRKVMVWEILNQKLL